MAAQPELMAHHCGEAGLNEKAIGYWLKAGHESVARSAMMEAVAQLQKGLDLLAKLPDNATRKQQELDLQVAFGPALIATKGYSAPEIGEVLARATAIAEQVDRLEYLVPLIYGRFAYHVVRSEHHLALSLAERMERVGGLSKAQGELQGRYYRGIVHFFRGELEVARALFEECHDLGEPERRQAFLAMTAEDSYSIMLGYSAAALAYLGHFDQARSRVKKALSESRGLKHAYTEAYSLIFSCWVASLANLHGEVQRDATEMIDLANDGGFPWLLAIGTVFLGWSRALLGQPRDGLSLLTRGIAIVRSAGGMANETERLTYLADAYSALGQPRDGLNRLREAIQFVEATDERHHEAEIYRLQGHLLFCAGGDQAAAEESYRRAIAIAERQNAKALQLRAATSLAYVLRDQGKCVEAHDLLAPIYDWFTEGFDTPVLQEAKKLLDELSS